MKRSITSLSSISLLFMLLSFTEVKAQDFSEFNKYKYLLLSRGSVKKTGDINFSKKVVDRLIDTAVLRLGSWYGKHGVPVIYDESPVLNNGGDPCDIVYLNWDIQTKATFGSSCSFNFSAQNCSGQIVFSEACEQDDIVQKNYFDWINAVVDFSLAKHHFYHYKYTGQTQDTPNSANSQTIPVQNNTSNPKQVYVEQPKTITAAPVVSDVDLNIPFVAGAVNKRFALIVGNEDYSNFQKGLQSEANVMYALHDADIFSEYAEKVLGIAKDNIIHLSNATSRDMSRALDKISLLAKATNGEGEIYFYYAGHGYPDEVTKEAYLIPVDVDASELKYALRLKDVYQRLAEYPSKRILVFLDACFSGGARNQSLLASRGVKIKPKEETLTGNMVVLSAVTNNQSSLPYKEKGHGIFTYFLLKELQDTKGNITLGKMTQDLQEEVSVKSVLVNSREQTPTIITAPELGDNWKNWKIK